MKFKITFVLLMLTSISFAQLSYHSRGRVFGPDNKRLPSADVRTLLMDKPQLLESYNAGRTKKTAGNVLIVGGITCLFADLAIGFAQDSQYPSAFTYVGTAAILIAIPVKIGYARKIKKAVEGYNNPIAGNNRTRIEDVALCTNKYGAGVRITF